MYELRWHGRGGQGAITAAEILAEAAYYFSDKWKWVTVQPTFGAERRGAPIVASSRIADERIKVRSQVYSPDFVVVLDETLLGVVDVTMGLKSEGKLIINTPKKPNEINLDGNFKIITADATHVALKFDLKAAGLLVINTAILGAVVRGTELVSLDAVQKVIKKRFSGEKGEKNAKATKLTYEKTILS
ncbi:MAG: 2-oxoacid:acceptor oxidoreductase family protein [Candidatus Helarchaeota archaeon]